MEQKAVGSYYNLWMYYSTDGGSTWTLPGNGAGASVTATLDGSGHVNGFTGLVGGSGYETD